MKLDKKYLTLAAIAGSAIVLDQITKMYIHANFGVGESHPVISEFFNITYVRNPGAAFGIFRSSQELFRKIFFLSMPPIAMIIILSILRNVSNTDKWQVLSLSLIFGGAFGNYIDRLRFGYVIDFLDFHLKEYYSWPAFNIADSCIVVGVCMLVLFMFLQDKKESSADKAKAS